MPIRQPQYEQQTIQIDQENQPRNYNQSQPSNVQTHQHQPVSNRQNFSSNPAPTNSLTPPSQRSPDRRSAPPVLLPDHRAEEVENNRPRIPTPPQPSLSSNSHRESFPPNRPIPINSYSPKDPSFEVVSRQPNPSPPLTRRASPPIFVKEGSERGQGSPPPSHRRVSSGSQEIDVEPLFDPADFIDSYTSTSPSPSLTSQSPTTSPTHPQTPNDWFSSHPPREKEVKDFVVRIDPNSAILGTVAPRRRGASAGGLSLGLGNESGESLSSRTGGLIEEVRNVVSPSSLYSNHSNEERRGNSRSPSPREGRLSPRDRVEFGRNLEGGMI